MTTETTPLPPGGSRRRWMIGGALAVAALIVAFLAGYLPRLNARAKLAPEERVLLDARLAELAASDDAIIAEHARWALSR